MSPDTTSSPGTRRRELGAAAAAVVIAAFLLHQYVVLDLALLAGGYEFHYHIALFEPLPFASLRGFTPYQLWLHVARLLLLGPALVLLTGAVVVARARHDAGHAPRPPARSPPETPPPSPSQGPGAGVPPSRLALGACAVSLVATAVVLYTLRGRAIIDDELAYTAQARLYARGVLGDDVPMWSRGIEAFTVGSNVGLVGKYLFGAPLVQIPGVLFGIPALSHLPVAALTLWAFHRALRGAVGGNAAAWATVLLAVSPMFIFTHATALSNAPSLACMALAGLGLQLVREGRVRTGALLVGGALGFGLTVRIQAAVPFGGVIGLLALATLLRARRGDGVALLLVSGGAWVALVGAYDLLLFGDPLVLPWFRFDWADRLGFGRVWEGSSYVHTPWKAVENLAVTLVRFNGWWLGWPASFLVLGVWAVVGRPARGLAPWLSAGAGMLLFNLLYYSPGVSDTGAVYVFELLLPACALGGAAIAAAATRAPTLVSVGLAVHLVLGTGSFYVEQLARVGRLVEAIHAPAEAVLAQIEPPALLVTGKKESQLETQGWMESTFPVRWRNPDDPVIVYPEMDPAWVRMLIARHPDRTCWYLPGGAATPVPCASRWLAAERQR